MVPESLGLGHLVSGRNKKLNMVLANAGTGISIGFFVQPQTEKAGLQYYHVLLDIILEG